MTEQADEPNDIGRNFLLGYRKKIAKFLMRTFTYRSTFLYVTVSQSRQNTRLFLQSSELGSLTPLPLGLVPGGGGGVGTHSLAGEGWGDPNSDEGTDTVVL